MRWVLLLLTMTGERRDAVFDDHAVCAQVVRQMNSPSSYLHTPGVEAHCLPLPVLGKGEIEAACGKLFTVEQCKQQKVRE